GGAQGMARLVRLRTSGESVRRIAMDGNGVAGTLTVVPKVAGSRGGSQRERADVSAAGRERRAVAAPSEEGPQSKEAVVARLFDAFSRGALLSALPLLHPEVVFQPMTAEVTRAGEPYRGHEGI